jgi:hypothetical protein
LCIFHEPGDAAQQPLAADGANAPPLNRSAERLLLAGPMDRSGSFFPVQRLLSGTILWWAPGAAETGRTGTALFGQERSFGAVAGLLAQLGRWSGSVECASMSR